MGLTKAAEWPEEDRYYGVTAVLAALCMLHATLGLPSANCSLEMFPSNTGSYREMGAEQKEGTSLE